MTPILGIISETCKYPDSKPRCGFLYEWCTSWSPNASAKWSASGQLTSIPSIFYDRFPIPLWVISQSWQPWTSIGGLCLHNAVDWLNCGDTEAWMGYDPLRLKEIRKCEIYWHMYKLYIYTCYQMFIICTYTYNMCIIYTHMYYILYMCIYMYIYIYT